MKGGGLRTPFYRQRLRLSVDASFSQVDDLIKTQRRLGLGREYIRRTPVTVMPMDGAK